MNNTAVIPVERPGAQHKASEPILDIFDRRIAMLEALHFDIGAKLGKAKIRHLHTYNYADIVPLEVDHTLIPV